MLQSVFAVLFLLESWFSLTTFFPLRFQANKWTWKWKWKKCIHITRPMNKQRMAKRKSFQLTLFGFIDNRTETDFKAQLTKYEHHEWQISPREYSIHPHCFVLFGFVTNRGCILFTWIHNQIVSHWIKLKVVRLWKLHSNDLFPDSKEAHKTKTITAYYMTRFVYFMGVWIFGCILTKNWGKWLHWSWRRCIVFFICFVVFQWMYDFSRLISICEQRFFFEKLPEKPQNVTQMWYCSTT